MTRPTRGKDGKFTGSIGSGKTNTPTARPATPAPVQPAAANVCGIDGCTYPAAPGSFAPPHTAMSSCRSGGRNHCTCDTCF